VWEIRRGNPFREIRGKSGDIYEQASVKTFAGFFTGIPNIYSASPDSGAPVDYVRAVSSHHNEVELPQSPRAESSQIIPPIVMHLSCLPISPDFVYRYFIIPLRSFVRLRPRPKPGRGRAKDRPITPHHARVRTGSA